MECNILGNGPSRKSYVPNGNFSIGCKFLWTDADLSVILDNCIIDTFIQQPELIPEPTKLVIGVDNYFYAKQTLTPEQFEYLTSRTIEYYKIDSPAQFCNDPFPKDISLRLVPTSKFRKTLNTSHIAAELAIAKGYTKLNLYGIDNWFGDKTCMDSYIDIGELYGFKLEKSNMLNVEIKTFGWRQQWKYMINKYKHVEFNFVK